MEDTLITFETAKLAKEKGFKTYDYSTIKNCYDEFGKKLLLNSNYTHPDKYCDCVLQSSLQKWLREKHNLHIEPIYNSNLTEKYNVQVHSNEAFCVYDDQTDYEFYETALEIGLVEALKLIKI